MKIISKVISKNEFISRTNGVIPWLIDKWTVPSSLCGKDNVVFDTYSSAVQWANNAGLSSSVIEHYSEFIHNKDFNNYGHIVSDIIIPQNLAGSVTDYTDFYVTIPDNNGGYYDLFDTDSICHYKYVDGKPTRKIISGGTEVKILSYATVNKWYTFFIEYYTTIKTDYKRLLNPDPENPYVPKYSDAIEYYEAEVKPKNEVNRKIYSDLDVLFNARGGFGMFEWISKNIGKKAGANPSAATNSASYVIPILLTNSIDDLGEMSIFSTKWQSGVDYHNRAEEINKCFDSPCYGTVIDRPRYDDGKGISTDYDTYVVKEGSGNTTYKQNDYKENVFNAENCVNYTDLTISTYRSNFASYDGSNQITTYAYSPINGEVLYNASATTEEMPYIKEKFIVINDEFIKVIDGEYVIPKYPYNYVSQKQNTKIPVITDGAIKYAELNGKRFYAVKEGDKWKIYFIKKCDGYSGSEVIEDTYILYNNSLLLRNEFVGYTIYDGYFTYKGAMYYISGSAVIGMNNASANTDNSKVTITHQLDTKVANIITGYTDSKLELLRRKKVNTDELGNDLPGYIDFPLDRNGTNYNTAYDGCELDLLYKVGQFSDIEYQKKVGNVNYFNGNYLESIIFYHIDENGNKKDVTPVDGDDSRSTAREYFEGGDMYRYGLTVYCDITYYIGVTLEFDEENSRYIPSPGRHKGVKYVDTLTVNKSVGTFYMSDNSTFGFIYYELNGNTSAEYLCDFRDVSLTNMSYFEMEIMTFFDDNRGRDKIFKTDYWERNNGMIASPVFRPEYNLFSTTQQNTTDNIYIDRGISAAFERHLKLLETHNMEALENYGNGYFKISEY